MRRPRPPEKQQYAPRPLPASNLLHFHQPAYLAFAEILKPVLERLWQDVNSPTR